MGYKRRSKSDFKKKSFENFTPRADSGKPEPSKVDSYSSTIADRAFRDLRYTGLLATKADPNTTATTASSPYAILAKTNKVIDGVYPGLDNLDGNVVVQMMNSTKSKLIRNYDIGSLHLNVNYLYMNLNDKGATREGMKIAKAIDETKTKSKKTKDITKAGDGSTWDYAGKPTAINKYIGSAVNEALSRTSSEMLTQLAFSKYYVETNVAPTDGNNHTLILVLYQTMLQNLASILAKYYQTMSLEKELIDMGYNREAYFTIELYGLLKKAAFKSKLNALSSFIIGEYFDHDWKNQINTLINIPSRKSKSIRDPLLTVYSCHNIPNITVYDKSGDGKVELFKTADYNIDSNWFDQYVVDLNQKLDVSSILTWARQRFSGTSKVTAVEYFNDIIKRLDKITTVMAKFNADMTDVRTYLDLTSKIGLNYWQRGWSYDISSIPQIETSYNKILNDVFTNYLASPDTINWDSTVMRWTFSTFWHEFTGIPTYDKFNGGAFLSFSTKTNIHVDGKDVKSSGIAADDSIMLVPFLFSIADGTVYFTNRYGERVGMGSYNYSTDEINANHILSRLLPVSGQKGSLRIPQINVADSTNVVDQASAGYELMQTVFGIGQIKYSDGDANIALSKEIVSLIDLQIADVSNAMLSFSRSYAPFRVWINSGSRTVGFGSK